MTRELELSKMTIRCYDSPSTLEELAETLNRVILGQRVFHTFVDTARTCPQQEMGYHAVTEPVTVFSTEENGCLQQGLHVPIGAGIRLFDATFAGQPVIVEIFMLSIRIDQPYFFGEKELRYRNHAIAVAQPINQ